MLSSDSRLRNAVAVRTLGKSSGSVFTVNPHPVVWSALLVGNIDNVIRPLSLSRQRPAAASLRRIETEQSLELIDERGDLRLLVD